MPLVYFARPIDLTRLTTAQKEEYNRARRILSHSGWVVYEPSGAFHLTSIAQPSPVLQDINRYALQRADALVAFWPEAQTIGVPMELEAAHQQGKPILTVSTVGAESWSLAGIANNRVVSEITLNWTNELLERVVHPTEAERAARYGGALRVKLEPDAQMPVRGYSGDAGYDLFVYGDTVVPANGFADIPCGVSVDLDDGVWGMITGRSSTARKHGLLVTTGIIDTGWKGQLFAGVQNLTDKPFLAKHNSRLAQLILFPNLAQEQYTRTVEIQEMGDSDRGTAGFGSSGE